MVLKVEEAQGIFGHGYRLFIWHYIDNTTIFSVANSQTKQLQRRLGLQALDALLHSLLALKKNLMKVEVCCLGGSAYHGGHDARREATSVVVIPFFFSF